MGWEQTRGQEGPGGWTPLVHEELPGCEDPHHHLERGMSGHTSGLLGATARGQHFAQE